MKMYEVIPNAPIKTENELLVDMENDAELPILVSTPYFTMVEIELALAAVRRSGRSAENERFSFGQRNDLCGLPYQLHVTCKGAK